VKDTQLVFVIGSGRCGTKAIAKMLAGSEWIEAHHEYCRYSYQREAVLYKMGYISEHTMRDILDGIFYSAAFYSQAGLFMDSSHKLVPVCDVLVKAFPEARFIQLVRDGRKVCTSFFYKLQIHDDRAHEILKAWRDNTLPCPPPSEKYWWISAPYDDRWQRICWWWKESNAIIEREIPNRYLVRLEDLKASAEAVMKLTDYIGVPYSQSYYEFLQKPDHVYVPINYSMTEEQRLQFNEICGETMIQYGYENTEERDVDYL